MDGVKFRVPSKEEFERWRIQGEALSARLAKQGWIVPMDMQPAEAWKLAGKPAGETDSAFVAHYTESDGRSFEEMIRTLLASEFLADWKPLLQECVAAYRQGLFRITIPALLPVIEGAIVALGGKGKIVRRCKAQTEAQDPSRVGRMIWASLLSFVEVIFEDGRSSSGQVLNRNLILHGHSRPADWTLADSLRLFNALHAITFIAH
jgi:hypothetical protein